MTWYALLDTRTGSLVSVGVDGESGLPPHLIGFELPEGWTPARLDDEELGAIPRRLAHREQPRGDGSAALASRLLAEIDRARRHHRTFAVLTFTAVPSDGLPLSTKLSLAREALTGASRTSDVVAATARGTVIALLIETDEQGARDALFRMRDRIAREAGSWQVSLLLYPEDAEQIAALAHLAAA